MRLWDFDHLGFYRPMDDPSAHVYTFQGVSLPGSRLEKLHHVFARSFEKAGAEIQTCLEKERKVHGPLAWESTTSRSAARNVDSLLQRSVSVTPGGAGAAGKTDTPSSTKPETDVKSSVAEDVPKDGGGEAKNVAETTSIEGKSKQEEGRIDFVLDDGDTMEENTPTEVESVPEESEPVAELQAVVVDDTETEYDDATLDEEGSGAQVKGLEVEGRDGEKEVESEKLDNVAGEEIEESPRHEPIGAGTSVGSACDDFEGEK